MIIFGSILLLGIIWIAWECYRAPFDEDDFNDTYFQD